MLTYDPASDNSFSRGPKVKSTMCQVSELSSFWRRAGKGPENGWGVLLPFVARILFWETFMQPYR